MVKVLDRSLTVIEQDWRDWLDVKPTIVTQQDIHRRNLPMN